MLHNGTGASSTDLSRPRDRAMVPLSSPSSSSPTARVRPWSPGWAAASPPVGFKAVHLHGSVLGPGHQVGFVLHPPCTHQVLAHMAWTINLSTSKLMVVRSSCAQSSELLSYCTKMCPGTLMLASDIHVGAEGSLRPPGCCAAA